MKPSLLLILLFLATELLYGETAILPYKVENPSEYLPEETGYDYARLVALAAAMSKRDLVVVSPSLVEADVKHYKLDPQQTITGGDLMKLGKRGGYDTIIAGSLSKAKGKFRSRTIVFSCVERKVIGKIDVSAKSLFKLAEEEVREAFVQYAGTGPVKDMKSLDVAFVLDMSYAAGPDWPSVKRGIYGLSAKAMDTLGINTRVYLVPFSKKITSMNSSFANNSLTKLKKILADLNPTGPASGEQFVKSLEYAVKNVPWRQEANRMIVIIAGSSLKGAGFADGHGLRAAKKGIVIHGVVMGTLRDDDFALVGRLAEITGGKLMGVAYHQKLFDKDGGAIELYMERGRLFKSVVYVNTWKEGIIKAGKSGQFGKVKDRYEEIYIDNKGITANPQGLEDLYGKVTLEPILNKGKLQNNVDRVLQRVIDLTAVKGPGPGNVLGKVLLSDGKISFWSTITDQESLKFFKEKQSYSFFFPLGIIIRKNPEETYGMSFTPRAVKITSDFVPAMIKTNLSEIIGKKSYYMNEGLFFPPLWFVDVKVEELNQTGGKGDVRED